MEKPPTKAKRSAEQEEAPGPRQVEPARIVGVAGRYLGRFEPKIVGYAAPEEVGAEPVKRYDLSWQAFAGYPPRGAELIILTRSAIASCDGDPPEVVRKVIGDLPEAVRAKCEKADADPVEIAWLAGCWISRKVERHLPPPDGTDQGLRSQMIARRMDLLEAHPDVEHVQGDGWRGGSYADLDRFARDLEALDRANGDLLDEHERRETPGHPGPLKGVLLTILRGLGYPKPENLYRDDREPWTIPKARPR